MPSETSQHGFQYRGFTRPNVTSVPNDVFDVIAPELTETELRVLLYIVRRTSALTMESDVIAASQMAEGGTGLSRQAVIGGLMGLVDKGIIAVRDGDDEDAIPEVASYRLCLGEAPGDEPAPPQAATEPDASSLRSKLQTLLHADDEQADRFLAQYSGAKIAEKLALLEWKLQARTRGRPITDPIAWLTRALEQDTPVPPEAQQAMPQLADDPAIGSQPAAPPQAESLEKLRQSFGGPAHEELYLWAQIKAEVEQTTAAATFEKWFAQADIVALRHDRVVVAVPDQATLKQLTGRLSDVIPSAILTVLGYDDLPLEFVVASMP